jgi:hypothetical protein
MAHQNRIEQLENWRSDLNQGGLYDKLAAGKIATSEPHAAAIGNGTVQPYFVPVPITIKAQLGSPVRTNLQELQRHMVVIRIADHFRLRLQSVPSPPPSLPSVLLSWASAVSARQMSSLVISLLSQASAWYVLPRARLCALIVMFAC